MVKLLALLFSFLLLVVWIGLLAPQYKAIKNKSYRAVAIFMSVFALSVGALIAIIIYGDFWGMICEEKMSQFSVADERILGALALISVSGHFFCLWFVYFRKSWDYVRVNGYSGQQLRFMIDPEIKKLLGYPQ